MTWRRLGAMLVFALLATSDALGAKIGDIGVGDTTAASQALRFLGLTDPTVRLGLMGAVLLGATCGVLGSFIVLRRLSLMGDVLGHSVLPGVAIGFLVAGAKVPSYLFFGAMVAGLGATGLTSTIVRHSRIKQDAAMGLVLSGFFGIGIVLLTRIQKLPFGGQSGLDKFLFGQAAAIGPDDVAWMAAMAGVVVVAVVLFFRQLAVSSFDEVFAQSLGVPVRAIHYLLMALLTVATVISIQAVGVVLVSAMLIVPAASAYLLTDRLPVMVALSALFGVCAGVLGAFLSFLGPSLPTGPFMVVSAAAFFTCAYVLSPRYGVVVRLVRRVRKRRRVGIENLLKTVHNLQETEGVESPSLHQIAAHRNESPAQVRPWLRVATRRGLLAGGAEGVRLTERGFARAVAVVRNHRLWELFLTQEADIASDHVHDDAEEIEHVLGEDIVRRLERALNNPDEDPHGRTIPAAASLPTNDEKTQP